MRTRIRLAVAFLVVVCLTRAALAAPAISITTDRPDNVYQKGEAAVFTIALTDDQPVPQASVTCELSTDGFAQSESQTLEVKDGKAELRASRAEPCVLWLRVSWAREGARPLRQEGGAAFSPLEILPSMPAPDDFDQFWAAQIARLQAAPVNAKLEPMESGRDGVELFAITMDNLNDTKIYGYLAKPKGDGPFPALLQVQWAGVYSLQTGWVLGPAGEGFIALNINAHAIENGKPDEYYAQQNTGPLRGYPSQGRDDREKSYFLRMYLSCYRAADYLASRPEWDEKHFLVVGDSQGGGQSLVTAGMSPHVTALAANVPALCDLTAAAVGRAPGWPKMVAVAEGVPDPTQIQVARYFDAVNFARKVRVPALVGTGFADMTCPSTSVYAAYNVLQGPKQMVIDPPSGHGGDKPNWARARRAFVQEQAKR